MQRAHLFLTLSRSLHHFAHLPQPLPPHCQPWCLRRSPLPALFSRWWSPPSARAWCSGSSTRVSAEGAGRGLLGACRSALSARPPPPLPPLAGCSWAAHATRPPTSHAGIWGNGRTMNEEWYTAGVSLSARGLGLATAIRLRACCCDITQLYSAPDCDFRVCCPHTATALPMFTCCRSR